MNSTESPRRVIAPAKINLCLFLGPTRPDGRHELVTVFAPVTLADELLIAPADGGDDEVVCAAVPGPNLVSAALAGLRSRGWSAPPLRIEISKRIPVAAGMGGGSADAGALLRAAPAWAPVDAAAVAEIAVALGADVPSQIAPGPLLGTGAGEVLEPLPALAEHAVLVIPQPFALSTADVYREADRMSLPRAAAALEALREGVLAWAGTIGGRLPEPLAVNDLEAAAVSLRPEIDAALGAARDAGAEPALVCGSGPTVIGLYWGPGSLARAQAAATVVRGRFPQALAVAPWPAEEPAGDRAETANP